MVKQKKQCKKCLGIVPAGVYNKHDFKYEPPSRDSEIDRIRKVFTKRARQAMFIASFNKEFGANV